MPEYTAEVQRIVRDRYPGLSWLFTVRDFGLDEARVDLTGLVNEFDSSKSVGGGVIEGVYSILDIVCG